MAEQLVALPMEKVMKKYSNCHHIIRMLLAREQF